MGKTTVIITLIAVILLCLVYSLHKKQTEYNKLFSSWATQCLQDGGVTTITNVDKSGNEQYECVKNGEIINHVCGVGQCKDFLKQYQLCLESGASVEYCEEI